MFSKMVSEILYKVRAFLQELKRVLEKIAETAACYKVHPGSLSCLQT